MQRLQSGEDGEGPQPQVGTAPKMLWKIHHIFNEDRQLINIHLKSSVIYVNLGYFLSFFP